jgi:glycosyltransferase involved in cell wall biosynthesis
MEPAKLAIIIPALNESATIGGVIANALRFGKVIVVDDGSRDGTANIASEAGADVVRHEHNRGYDGALESGFARAAELGCICVMTMDADGQHDPNQASEFIAEIARGADVVIGVRNRRQRVTEHVFGWVANLLWGIRDPLCGAKAYRICVYRRRGHFDSYGSIGTELAIYAARSGLRVTQIPVSTRPRLDAPRFGSSLRANGRIFNAMWRGILYARPVPMAGK